MKEELQGKLVEILSSIQAAAGKASDFALGQLPDIAQSYIAYGRALYTLAVVVGVLLLALAFATKHWGNAAVEKSKQRYRDKHDGREPGYLDYYDGDGYWLVAGLSGLVGLMTVGMAMQPALMVWMAPKVWLLKEIASLVK